MSPREFPLSVTGEVRALIDDQTVRVTAARNRITVDVPGVRTGLAALRSAGGRTARATVLPRLDTLLRMTDLSVRINMAGGTLAVMGADAHPGVLSRWLGVAPLEVRLSGVASVIRGLWSKT